MSAKVTVYDAGGGPGRTGLDFETISASQMQMYRRTIGNMSAVMVYNAEQEQRQLGITEQLVEIRVHVCREDFPVVRAYIDIAYYPSAAQQVWGKFLADVCKALKIEFVHSILERGDKACVSRILRLKNGGDYLVRQRENSAVMEVLNNGQAPMDNSWAITSMIADVKKDLDLGFKNLPAVNERVRHLVSQLRTSDEEKAAAETILSAKQPIDVVSTVSMIYLDNKEDITPEELSLLALSTRFGDIAKFEDKIDIITLHRLCLETLNRFAASGQATKVVNQTMQYVFKVAEQLLHEVDIITMALRLVSDIMPLLSSYRDQCLQVTFKALHHYSPPNPVHRPRESEGASHARVPTITHPIASSGISASSHGGTAIGPTLSSSHPRAMAPVQPPKSQFRPPSELTRYDNQYATGEQKRKYQLQSQQVSSFIKSVELDEHCRPITPRTAARRKQAKQAPVAAPVVVVEAPAEAKPQILIRQRDRQDHGAARQAIQSALQAKDSHSGHGHGHGHHGHSHGSHAHGHSSHGHSGHGSSDDETGRGSESNSTPAVHTSSSSAATASQAADPSESLSRFQAQSVQAGSHLPSLPGISENQSAGRPRSSGQKARPTYRIHDRRREEENEGEDSSAVAAWKGSRGVLGRVAVARRAEEEVRGKYNAATSSTISSSAPVSVSAMASAPLTVTPAPTILSGVRLPAVSTALSAVVPPPETSEDPSSPPAPTEEIVPISSWVPAFSGPRGKKKVILEKLPDVACSIFRGFAGQMQANVVLVQAFATLLRMMTVSYANRDLGFKRNALEMAADIVLVCAAIPKVLEYYVELVSTMYADGFGDPARDLTQPLAGEEDPTLVLSQEETSQTNPPPPLEGKDVGIAPGPSILSVETTTGSAMGMVVEMVSELSLPSFDPENAPDDPVVRRLPEILETGDDENEAAVVSATTSRAVLPEESAAGDKAEGEEEDAKRRKVEEDRSRAEAAEITKQLLEERYRRRPAEKIIMALAMSAAHVEVRERERSAAAVWLEIWNDNSREYKLAVLKGKNLCGL